MLRLARSADARLHNIAGNAFSAPAYRRAGQQRAKPDNAQALA